MYLTFNEKIDRSNRSCPIFQRTNIMLKATIILDNWIASCLSPVEFVREYYLTNQAIKDLVLIKVEQGDEELLPDDKNKNS